MVAKKRALPIYLRATRAAARHGATIKVLVDNDVKHWATRFIAALTQPGTVARGQREVNGRGSKCSRALRYAPA